MTKKWLHRFVSATVIGYAIGCTFGNYARAQGVPHNITRDTTLGAESSQVTPGNFSTITGGATRGGNLFHSFSQFNVGTGGQAFFNNALNIQNIISRVTGASLSNIDGLIRANGGANLFLINPNGIVFGPNASLQIGGSFVASTANSVKFENNMEFSATNPQAPPLLAVKIPIGLQFNGPAQSITNQSKFGLNVLPFRTLGLVGGDVNLDGGIVNASDGQVQLGGLAGAGMVELIAENNLVLRGLQFPTDVTLADVSITNGAIVDVIAAENGGSVFINGRNITVSGGSKICAGIGITQSCGNDGTGNAGSPLSRAGNILLNATDKVIISQSSITNDVRPGATGNLGEFSNIIQAIQNNILFGSIIINTGSLDIINPGALEQNRAVISTRTLGRGNAGAVGIFAVMLPSIVVVF